MLVLNPFLMLYLGELKCPFKNEEKEKKEKKKRMRKVEVFIYFYPNIEVK